MASEVKKFKAKIKKEGSALGWRIVDIPFSVKNAFGNGGRVPVRGTVNGFPFRTSLFPRKGGKHFLMINKAMQRGAGATELGEIVAVELRVDDDERTVEIPKELRDALDGEPELLAYYESLNYSTRKWMADSVLQPRSSAARIRRSERLASQLWEMRDGEIDPPPLLKAAFQGNPKAEQGWKNMPISHRRGHLFGIFATATPESRNKRLGKAIEMMVMYSEKRSFKT